jgi:hypothetical protein
LGENCTLPHHHHHCYLSPFFFSVPSILITLQFLLHFSIHIRSIIWFLCNITRTPHKITFFLFLVIASLQILFVKGEIEQFTCFFLSDCIEVNVGQTMIVLVKIGQDHPPSIRCFYVFSLLFFLFIKSRSSLTLTLMDCR